MNSNNLNAPPTCNNIESYRFANKIWVEVLFGSKSTTAHRRAVITAIIPILSGGLLSAINGFSSQYWANPAIYYGAFGIYLTAIVIWHGAINQYSIYSSFLSAFSITDTCKRSIIKDMLGRFSNTRAQARTIILCIMITMALTTLSYFDFLLLPLKQHAPFIGDLRFIDFINAGWHKSEHIYTAYTITSLFAITASIFLGTAFNLMLQMSRIVLLCRKLNSQLFPRFIKLHFGPLTAFYSLVSVLWCVGVALLVLLSRNTDSWALKIAVGFLALLGIVNVMIPQVIYIAIAEKAEEHWLSQAALETASAFTAQESSATHLRHSIFSTDGYFFTYERFVYPIHEAYFVIVAQALSIFSFGLFK